MNYDTLISLAKYYWPAISLEETFSENKRSVIKIIGALFLVIGLAGIGLIYLPLPNAVLAELSLIQSTLARYQTIMQFMSMIGFLGWFSMFLLDSFYHSFLFSGMISALPEHKQGPVKLYFEIAEILKSDPGNPTRALAVSTVGREILIRAGLEPRLFAELQSSLDPNSFVWPVDQTYTIERFVRILIEHDEAFMRSLFKQGISKDDLIGSAEWVATRINNYKLHKRKWGKESLGRIPGLAKDWSYGYVYYLEKYALPIDSTSAYQEVSLDTHHHEKEAREIEGILARGREANVLLVGKEGVGKLEIMARVAKEISRGNIFPQLEHKKIYVVDGQAIISSNSGKNTFEETLRLVFTEAAKAGNIILVITDLHAVIQSAQAVGSDLISLLDPYLTSNSLQIVGITNEQAYFGLLERIPKIIQRFDKVDVAEADRSNSLRVVLEKATMLEYRYHFIATYPAMAKLVDNANRYITSGVMPDKALDILLEFSTLAQQNHQSIITKKAIDEFFTQKTNIPVGEIKQEERETLMQLESRLHARVIGQEEAVKAVATTMRRSRAGVQNPDRPIGSFLFLGPTGVGKTEVSKALAQAFFGSEESMMRFDMSEYKTYDALDKLIGSFQSGQSGTLVKALKQKPYGLLLLDEFEKSTDQVKDLFLQILDEGKFSDMNGNMVNAQNTIIIATSNAGADTIWQLFKQGKNPANFKQDLINKIISEGVYKPELLNRFDGIVVFHPLGEPALLQIANLMLAKLKKRILSNKGIEVDFAQEVVAIIATKGSNPQFGARPMNRYIQEHIEQIIADKIITEGVGAGSQLIITGQDLSSFT